MPATIADVARELGISSSTVSKALNDYHDIPVETKARVAEAVQRLGYHPSAAARSLRRQSAQRIGVVNIINSYNYDYFTEQVRGITTAAEQFDYSVLLYTNIHSQPQRLQRICRSREVDGIVLMSAGEAAEAIDMSLAEDLPVVLMGRETRTDVSYITADACQGSLLATRHLIALGHRRIGLLGSLLDPLSGAERLAGYREALAEAGIEFDSGLVAEAPYELGGGCGPTDELLDQRPRPTAIIAICDTLAHEALQSIAAHHLRVPEDIAVAALGDSRLTQLAAPPLTSVREPLFEMGEKSVEMLLAAIADRQQAPQRVICPVSLVVRASTAGRS